MDPILTLVGALMLVISIVLSPLSSRLGMPVLLIFLAVGMIMGQDGPGGIRFDDYQLAFLIASLALGVILLDGGMRTRAETFRVGLRPALVLATLGHDRCRRSGRGLVGVRFALDAGVTGWRYYLVYRRCRCVLDAARQRRSSQRACQRHLGNRVWQQRSHGHFPDVADGHPDW
jgi:hypothetical protein